MGNKLITYNVDSDSVYESYWPTIDRAFHSTYTYLALHTEIAQLAIL